MNNTIFKIMDVNSGETLTARRTRLEAIEVVDGLLTLGLDMIFVIIECEKFQVENQHILFHGESFYGETIVNCSFAITAFGYRMVGHWECRENGETYNVEQFGRGNWQVRSVVNS